jgi:hypothetical protein
MQTKIYTRKGPKAPFFIQVETAETEDRQLRNGKIVAVNKSSHVEVTDMGKKSALDTLYSEVMSGEPEHVLISFDVVEQFGAFHGIVNYRVGSEHKQKRF